MCYIKLKRTYKFGSSYYYEIETFLYPPSTLCLILRSLPEEEKDNKKILLKAINEKQYKRNKSNLYFSPVIVIGNQFITNINPKKTSTHMLYTYLNILLEQYDMDNYTIQKLERTINGRIDKQENIDKKRKALALYSYPLNLPLKKRKIIIC
jgi:hypothetical protein